MVFVMGEKSNIFTLVIIQLCGEYTAVTHHVIHTLIRNMFVLTFLWDICVNFIRDRSATVVRMWRLSEQRTKNKEHTYILKYTPQSPYHKQFHKMVKGIFILIKQYVNISILYKIRAMQKMIYVCHKQTQVDYLSPERVSLGLQNLGTSCPRPPLATCLILCLTSWKLDNSLGENKPLEQMRVPKSHQHRLVYIPTPLWGSTAQLPDLCLKYSARPPQSTRSWDDNM